MRQKRSDCCKRLQALEAARDRLLAENAKLQEQAHERNSLLTLIDQLPDYLYVKDRQSRVLIANKAFASDCPVAGPAEMVGKSDFDFHTLELAQQFFAEEQALMQSGEPMIDHEEFVFDRSGNKKWLSSTKVPVRNEAGEIVGLVGVARDVTERKQAEELRAAEAQVLEMIAISAPLAEVLDRLVRMIDGQLPGLFGSILLLDQDGVHLRHGAAPSLPESYVKIVDGIRIGPKVGSCGTAVYRRESVVVSDIATSPLWEDYRELVAPYEFRSCWSTPIMSHEGNVLGVFAIYSTQARTPSPGELKLIEVSTRIAGIAIERREAEERIRFMAHHDSLTGLPNRSLLKDRLVQGMRYAERYDRWMSVVFVDLDNFKLINDTLGHNAGDELLKIVAKRMVECVRPSDTVVRLGGDEFVIVLFDQPKSTDTIRARLQTLREALAKPIRLDGREFQVASSIGVANYPGDGVDAESLLAHADAAMYHAKALGRDNCQFYTAEMNGEADRSRFIQEELRWAVSSGQLFVLYQPQIDLLSEKILAVEALVRWNHPKLGVIPPAEFIPVAEETGLIVPIGDWVLRTACRQNKAWQDLGMPPVRVGVNVSARQFKEKNWVARVEAALRESGLDPGYLELELTESLIMDDVSRAVATMRELEALGVQLAIDDFGTGYSSLSALKNFPVARLKIDRSFVHEIPYSFVHEIPYDEDDNAIVAAVISLGQKLNLRVIAEGVENSKQVEFLRSNNCREIQGYHFSKPVSSKEIEELLRAQACAENGSAVRLGSSGAAHPFIVG